MRFTVRHPAAEGERFAADAFEGAIGTDVAFRQDAVNLRGTWFKDAWLVAVPRQGIARLVAAEVARDGMSVEFTLEIETPPDPEEQP